MRTKNSHKNSTTQFFLGVAALALGQALQDGDGFGTHLAFVWLTIALISAGAGILSQLRYFPPVSPKELRAVLTVGLVWQIFQVLTALPGRGILPAFQHDRWLFQVAVVLAGGFALLSLAPKTWFPTRLQRGFIGLTLIAASVAGVWMIRVSPNPFIDVYMFHQTSSEALSQGHNPYELTQPNIYDHMGFYGAELVNDGKMTIGNPYPPMSIYLSWLGYVLGGDVRYSHFAAIILAFSLMASLRPSRETLLAAYIFLFTPRAFFVIESSWTEPLVLFLSVAVVWCAVRRPAWVPVALGLLVASKQYMIFMLPLAILIIPNDARRCVPLQTMVRAVVSAFVVTAPLAFWNFSAFLWNVGLAQWYQIFRWNSLSYAALYARGTNQLPTQFLPFISLCVAFLLVWRYASRSPTGFAASLAFSLGVFFAFSKQAFCNYYFLVIGLLCCALAAMPLPDDPLKPVEYKADDG